jgi:raffinose/stachyose/melibiose transport system substrate-binding protein
MNRKLSAVVLLLALLLPFSLRIGAAQDKLTLTVWDTFSDPTDGEAAQAVYDAFTEQNPNVEIKREVFQLEQIQAIAKTSLAAGTGPDLLYYDTGPGFAGVLADAGLLRPIDDMARQYGWTERIYPWARSLSTFDGQLYGMGLEAEFVGLFVNETIFEEEGWTVPETYDDLLAYCATAREAGYTPTAFSMNPGWQSYHPFSGMVSNILGVDELRAMVQGDGGWDRPEVARAIQLFFRDTEEAGCFIPDVNGVTYDDGNALFFGGQAPLHITGTWLTAEIEENAPDYEFSLIPFPAVEGGQGRYYPAGIGSAFFVSAKTAHPEQAAMLLDHVFSQESARSWVSVAGFIPPMEFDASGWDLTPLKRFTVDAMQSAGGQPGGGTPAAGEASFSLFVELFSPEQFIAVLEDGSQAVIAGSKTPEQQAADLQQAWEEGRAR